MTLRTPAIKFTAPAWRIAPILALILLAGGSAFAQVRVQGGFLTDSLKVGEETAFYLSARYPAKETILFPDSSHQFAPFEYLRKKYYPTETNNGISTDSAIYFLSTFELDRSQFLSLPVYMVNEQDCTTYYSNPDTIRLVLIVKEAIDSISIEQLPLKENTAYYKVNFQFNYFILMIVAGILLMIVLVGWIIFGDRIRQYLQAKKLRRRHRQFVDAYNGLIHKIQNAFSPAETESALALWKKYMEQLEAKPYTKLTSPETVALIRDQQLGQNLRVIDRAIYGGGSAVEEPLRHLQTVADQTFQKKLEEVKHGK